VSRRRPPVREGKGGRAAARYGGRGVHRRPLSRKEGRAVARSGGRRGARRRPPSRKEGRARAAASSGREVGLPNPAAESWGRRL
jgi:hypothetical protein